MPRTKKAAGTAVDARNGRRLELAAHSAALEVPLPRARETYQPLAIATWDGYWADAVSSTVTSADLMIVWTWIDAYDEALVKRAQADLEPLVEGSMGQMVANPLYAVAAGQMTLAMQCARQLGIGAKHRADLGVALIAEKRGLDELNAAYLTEEDPDDDDDDDPRIVVGDPG